ncbi:ABC bile acid transporter [Cordyceps javanica]|uniref:ABC bile acid transporter n=1 Tax=Cordyceps javanica TaxID=43265 RepID=A0A545WC07_9HYPO|nr:ABC bile acid transporter [Cordyceps javanica]TQW11492.1 ABC bile acid transporter [Cordyceps javanica]
MAAARRAVHVGPDDQLWGPQLPGHADFTLVFEQSMLSILPACMLLGAAPIHIGHLLRGRPCVRPGLLLWTKLAFVLALVGCHAAAIYTWTRPEYSTHISVTASLFCLLSGICVGALIYVEHIYTITPSALVSLYLTVALVFDIARARSYFLRNGLDVVGRLAVTTAVLESSLVLLLEISKRALVRDGISATFGREAFSGFWNRRLFLWINSTLLLGFRSILSVDDLPDLGPEFDSQHLHTKFTQHWGQADKHAKYALAKACFYTLPWQFICVMIPRLCYTGFTFAQPFLIRRAIEIVKEDDVSAEETSGLIAATAVIYFGLAISKAYYQHLNYRFATYMRGILVTEMCHKVLTLNEGQLRESAILTLMTADIAGVERVCSDFHNAIASVVELGLGLFVLSRVVGGASFLVLIPAGLATIMLSVVTKRMGKARANWNQRSQERVAATSLALQQMKSIKATGLSGFISEHLQSLREAEIKVSLSERHLLISIYATREFSNGFTPVIVIAGAIFWTTSLSGLGIANIFTALSMVSIMMEPLGTALVALPFLAAGLASLDRIQKFLAKQDCFDLQFTTPSECFEKGPLPEFEFGLENASFHNHGYEKPLFKNVNMKPGRGQIGMVVGKVGSGKSTLLKALVGEVQLTSGSIYGSQEPIGYCDQTPWIEDGNILDNVLGRNEYNEDRIKIVIQACALDDDIAQLDAGIFTAVGAGGCRLSGGQKSRLALARALYLGPRIMILDDILGSLDESTSETVLHRLVGADGLLRTMGITVFLTTSTRDHLDYADVVYLLGEDGSVKVVDKPSRAAFDDGVFRNALRDKDEVLDSKEEAFIGQAPRVEALNKLSSELDRSARQKGDVVLYGYYAKTFGLAIFIPWLLLAIVSAASSRLPSIYMRIWLEVAPTTDAYFAGFAKSTTLVVDVGIVASGATYAFVIVPFCIALVYILQKFYLRTSRQVRLLDIEAKAPLFDRLGDAKNAMPHIRAFRWQKPFVKQCLELIDFSQKPYYLMFCIQRWLTIVLDLSVGAIAIVLITFAVKFRSTTSQAAIGLALVNLTTFSQSLSKMITWWISLETAFGAVARVKSFVVTTPSEESVPDDLDDKDLQSWPEHGAIELDHVSSTYVTPTNAKQVGIDDFTISIPDGEAVSIVGRTGSGKSSLILTLLHCVDYTGTITIGGRNIRTVPVERLREKITTIPQEGVELPGTVRTNVDPYSKKGSHTPESDAKIINLLRRLCIWEGIQNRGGLDAEFSKLNLSKGQKQLVFLARAMLRRDTTHSKVVFMDEATSSVDEETDIQVRDVINGSFAGSTVISITHRAYVAQDSDRVIEITRGQIGTELRRRPGYEYS